MFTRSRIRTLHRCPLRVHTLNTHSRWTVDSQGTDDVPIDKGRGSTSTDPPGG